MPKQGKREKGIKRKQSSIEEATGSLSTAHSPISVQALNGI